MDALTTAELSEGDLVASAVQRVLKGLFDVGMLGNIVGRDGASGQTAGPFAGGWVFAGFNNEGKGLRNIPGTGKSSVTIISRDSWAANNHNTQEFPILRVVVDSDCARDSMGNIIARDADMRCKQVAKVVRDVLHDPGNEHHDWPLGVSVNTCLCVQQLSITDAPGSDGAVWGSMTFNVSLG